MATIGTFMNLLPIPLLFFAAICAKVALWTSLLVKWNFPLSEIPGPKLARWTRLWLIETLYSGKWAEELVNLHQKHGKHDLFFQPRKLLNYSNYGWVGPIVRIGPRHVIISDPESVRKVLAAGSKYTRGPWFDTLRLHPNRANVISERNPEKHQQLRQVLGPAVSVLTILHERYSNLNNLVGRERHL